jgi:hypothetical protein
MIFVRGFDPGTLDNFVTNKIPGLEDVDSSGTRPSGTVLIMDRFRLVADRVKAMVQRVPLLVSF